MNFSITPQERKYCDRYFRGKTPQEIAQEKETIIAHITKTGGAEDEFIYISSREISSWGDFFFATCLKGQIRNKASAYRVLAQELTDYDIEEFHPDKYNQRVFKAKISRKKGILEEIVEEL